MARIIENKWEPIGGNLIPDIEGFISPKRDAVDFSKIGTCTMEHRHSYWTKYGVERLITQLQLLHSTMTE